MCFDPLVDVDGKLMTGQPLSQRRSQLEVFSTRRGKPTCLPFAGFPEREADEWMVKLAATGLDRAVVKKLDEPYRSGERTGIVKIKRMRTADCAVGGFRYSEKECGIRLPT